MSRFETTDNHPAAATGEVRDVAARLARLRRLSQLMDSAMRLPGGFRVGWDGIIGLVPFVGDVITGGISAYIIWQGVKLGLPRSLVLRMIFNVLIDTGIGSVPLVGDAFDVAFKANIRNVSLMEKHLLGSAAGRSH